MHTLDQFEVNRLAKLVEESGTLEKSPSELLDIFGKKYIDGHDSNSLRFCLMVEMFRGNLPFKYRLEDRVSDNPKDTNRIYILEAHENQQNVVLDVEALN